MTVTMDERLLEARIIIYKLISNLYKEPTEDFLTSLEMMETVTEEYDMELFQTINDMKREVKSHSSNLEPLLVDYARLFIGPFNVLAPPYSSIYLEDKREVMGRSTTVVEDYYKKAGLQITNRNEPADHLCFQFEFLYYLNHQLANTDKYHYIDLQTEFYQNIFVKWIPKFTFALKEGATTEFYRKLSLLTRLFVEKEAVIVHQLY